MTKVIDLEKIPSEIVDPAKRQAVDDAIRKAVRDVQAAVRGLQKEDLHATSATVEAWQEVKRALVDRRDKAWQHIKEDNSLVESEKAQRLAMWRGWYVTRASYCNTVLRVLTEYPQAEWEFDEIIKTIVPGRPIASIAAEVATVPVPPQARQHGALITIARQAVEGLREWEHTHNVSKLRLEPLFQMNEKELALRWATGSILRPDYNIEFGGLIARAREMNEELFV